MIVTLLAAMLNGAVADSQASPLPSPPPATARPAGPIADRWPNGGRGSRAALFISPMGEPFRGGATRSEDLEAWFVRADRDGNGSLSAQEMQDDTARFFATLDRGQDHEIDPDDINRYENEIVPEIRMGFVPGMG